ncbi:carboxylesterase/lipase family protein [Pseudoduganella albidiflava]|uniref:Carboxylic ester hydrolase n=1 Tax=Pseudoduganella albidiflava TaxID=321983 RepID=A0A411X3G1_9BURK|nr:carboxylesterase family protein [Pseudoduganella albidiflava]QBI03464.1 carboxylesterase family protein [Pseudoduganella albidiflava]GGY50197.1 carboxylic ester hydrolase [Pseudoduganella albidiflava]
MKAASAGILLAAASTLAQGAGPVTTVKVDGGRIEGRIEDGVRVFKGIPFAAPPVGELRWQAPQPVRPWQGVRQAGDFGNRCMQLPLFSDMVFRSPGQSEDCLYLNVWAPASSGAGKKKALPVLVYIHGGGLATGDGSEPRYEGAAMAKQGIVALTINYRLGAFGFLAHPELTAESRYNASGNYGLMDQSAALAWVKKNIAAFGGDPAQVTIAGESAGSYSVSAQMIMPMSKGLFARAIGESGSVLGRRGAPPLAEAEKQGAAFAQGAGFATLKELRAAPAEALLEAQAKPGVPWFGIVTDGHVFDRAPLDTYAQGRQAKVPLLAGWNSQEMHAGAILDNQEPTPERFQAVLKKFYGNDAAAAARVYDYDVADAARDLSSDRWIVYGTWKWIDLHAKAAPTWRYYYSRPRPATVDGQPAATGAAHSAEIEYAMGNLDGNKVYAWTDEDRTVSRTMQGYFANFIKHGDPNGAGLPAWPKATQPGASVMRLDVQSGAYDPQDRARFEFHDRQAAKP